jgi:isopenicillin N synthase-like dioxygenase
VIDISRFLHGSEAERAAVAAAWDEAFTGVGFCLLTGFESLLPTASVRSLRETATRYFAQSTKDLKMQAHVDGMVGYLGVGDENVAASTGETNSVPDLVESLNLPGYQEPSAPWRSDPSAGEVPWRDAAFARALPAELADAAAEYWRGATRLMLSLMELSELALDLPAGTFAPSFAEPGTLLRLAYYPAGAAAPNQLRYGAHTDYDGFTLLERGEEGGEEGSGGLEIQDCLSDAFRPVPAPPGTLTINIGDLLARWTNDRWRATPHVCCSGARTLDGQLVACSARTHTFAPRPPYRDSVCPRRRCTARPHSAVA